MVNLSDIQHANAALKSAPPGLTAVVAGGTNGIGRAFVEQLAANTTDPTIYLIGRSAASLDSVIGHLKTLNASGTYIPIQAADLTLVASAHDAATQIAAALDKAGDEKGKIDILFLSPGYLSFSKRDESPEGLDRLSAIRFYSRARIVLDLLPALERAPSPRVVWVLAAGTEGTAYPDDLGLKDPKHSGPVSAAGTIVTYSSLFLDQLAKRHPSVSFVHVHPGVVRTGIMTNPEHFGSVWGWFINWVFWPTIGRLISISKEQAGQNQLFIATNPEFVAAKQGGEGKLAATGLDGNKGSGAYRVNVKCETVSPSKVLQQYRESGLGEKVWGYTLAEHARILERN